MTDNESTEMIEAFWQRYLVTLPAAERERRTVRPPAWSFGDGPEMADELGELVCRGTKTATCSLYWEYQKTGEALPEVGALSIVLDGRGAPLCIIETTEITIQPFDQVLSDFARDEGEGDLSLDHWRDGHWRYFSRLCQDLGLQPEQSMPLVCERFRLVFAAE